MSSAAFLTSNDQLSRLIQQQAAVLYERLHTLDADALGMPYSCLAYFKGSHHKRLFFSIETSAHLLYRSITLIGKPVTEVVLMDYGAGVGTLYTLAKMIGCKKVIYNDHLQEWQQSAQLIAKAIDVEVDEYLVGDIDETLNQLRNKNLQCDLIISRNVIEHIYKLDEFYRAIALAQPQACVYSSTTANYKNPASRVKHWLWHRKWEKVFFPQRIALIQKMAPQLPEGTVRQLAKTTRGQAGNDIADTVHNYLATKELRKTQGVRSNTCDPANGVWFEHLIKFEEYQQLIEPAGYRVMFFPGFWDTHYSTGWKNTLGQMLNAIIRSNKTIGLMLAPFIYVVAQKK